MSLSRTILAASVTFAIATAVAPFTGLGLIERAHADSLPATKEAQASAEGALKEFVEYKNSERGISIEYPKTWEMIEPKDSPIICKFKGLGGLVSYRVYSEPLPATMTLEAYTKASLDALKNGMAQANIPIEMVSEKAAVFAGSPATEITYIIKDIEAKCTAKALMIMTTNKSRGFGLNYTADSEYYDTFMPVINAASKSMKVL